MTGDEGLGTERLDDATLLAAGVPVDSSRERVELDAGLQALTGTGTLPEAAASDIGEQRPVEAPGRANASAPAGLRLVEQVALESDGIDSGLEDAVAPEAPAFVAGPPCVEDALPAARGALPGSQARGLVTEDGSASSSPSPEPAWTEEVDSMVAVEDEVRVELKELGHVAMTEAAEAEELGPAVAAEAAPPATSATPAAEWGGGLRGDGASEQLVEVDDRVLSGDPDGATELPRRAAAPEETEPLGMSRSADVEPAPADVQASERPAPASPSRRGHDKPRDRSGAPRDRVAREGRGGAPAQESQGAPTIHITQHIDARGSPHPEAIRTAALEGAQAGVLGAFAQGGEQAGAAFGKRVRSGS